jgi:hypothetical protein
MTQNWQRRRAGREVFGCSCSCSCLKVDDELESNSDDEKKEGRVYQQHIFHVYVKISVKKIWCIWCIRVYVG